MSRWRMAWGVFVLLLALVGGATAVWGTIELGRDLVFLRALRIASQQLHPAKP